jgi:cytochrome P450
MTVSDEVQACPHVSGIEWPSMELVECPFPYYERLRRDAPVMKYPGRDQYLLSRWEDIIHVAEDPETFVQDDVLLPEDAFVTDDPLTPVSMAITNPPEHRRKRSLGLDFVSTARLTSYEPMIAAIADDLIDRVIDRGRMEFYQEFANQLPVRLVADVLGLPKEDNEMFVKWYEGSAPAAAAFLPEEERLEQERGRAEALAYMTAAVEDRYHNPRDDFLSEFIQLQVKRDGRPALGYLTQEADLLLFAGNVTTTHMMSSMMLLMCKHPDQYRMLVNDRSLVRNLVEETLRIEAPVQWLQRRVAADVRIGGVDIPKNSMVVMIWASGNRDELKWGENAGEFRIDRPAVAKHNLAFGRGNHRCLGAPLARLEGRIAFERILARMNKIRLLPGHENPPHLPNILFRAPSEVHIEFEAG